jgi:hypothetical protein
MMADGSLFAARLDDNAERLGEVGMSDTNAPVAVERAGNRLLLRIVDQAWHMTAAEAHALAAAIESGQALKIGALSVEQSGSEVILWICLRCRRLTRAEAEALAALLRSEAADAGLDARLS